MHSGNKKESQPLLQNFKEAEAFLLSLVNYEQLPPPMTQDTEGWHLREFASFLDKLGRPQDQLKIIHVAGTKGKGSTTRLISCLLSGQNFERVGSFTSPHIESFRERICIDNELISEDDFVTALNAVQRVLPARNGEGFRTTFEVLTAMALWHFREKKCQAVVLETGLGGRLDSTNAVTAKVALLTTMGLEHQRVLGPTLKHIAREKAGIITPGTACAIVGPQMPRRAKTVIEAARAQAEKSNVPLTVYEKKYSIVRQAKPHPWGFELDLKINDHDLEKISFHTLGEHQLNNLRAAWMAAQAFCRIEAREINYPGIRTAIESFRSPGRLETISREPLILADSAHCPTSARAVMESCAIHFGPRKVILILGLMQDKKPEPILRNFNRNGQIIALFTHTPPSPRARKSHDLAQLAKNLFPHVEAMDNVEQALEAAWKFQRQTPEALILVSGTTYSISAARSWVKKKMNQKTP